MNTNQDWTFFGNMLMDLDTIGHFSHTLKCMNVIALDIKKKKHHTKYHLQSLKQNISL